MIIKSNRISTTTAARRVIDHLCNGDENDAVTVLQGTERDLLDAWRDARNHGAMKALRVWILSPAEETSREQAMVALGRIAVEFEFDIGRAFIVEHDKARAVPEAFARHWHMAVAEVDAASGRVLSSSHDHVRHEFLARSMEAELGHPFIPGAHTRAVLARLRREGRSAVADALDAATEPTDEERPREAYTTTRHRLAKRKGVDLPAARAVIAAAWSACTSLAELTSTLAESGLDLAVGDGAGEWVITKDGYLLGSLRRLTRGRKIEFTRRMKEIVDVNSSGRSDAGAEDLRGVGRNPPGGGGHSRVREFARNAQSSGRIVPGDHDEITEHAGHGNRGNPPQLGRPAHYDDGAGVRGCDAFGDPGGLILAVEGCVRAVFGLAMRAEAVATPALARVETALDRYTASEKFAMSRESSRPARTDLDAAVAREAAERAATQAIADEVDGITERIGDLIRASRARGRSLWSRLFRDTKTETLVATLRGQRVTLQAHHAIAQRKHIRAINAEALARRVFLQATVERNAGRTAALQAAKSRLAVVERARTLLRHWPALAYAGARRLLAMATRIEKAREKGWDPGPATTDVKVG